MAVAALAVMPGLGLVASKFLRDDAAYDRRTRRRQRQRIRQAIQRLMRRRLVRYIEQGKEIRLVITKAGVTEVKKFGFEHLAIRPPKRWDGRWRLVIFDIPERNRLGRQALRFKLQELGFYPLQKSVLAYPHECQDEIDFVANFCDVARHVVYLTCNELGRREVAVRNYFNLLD